MKKNKHTHNTHAQPGLLNKKSFYTGSLPALPESTAEPKGKIVSWHWEPMHETFGMPKKTSAIA
ncbi:MAG: hypothetical protein IPP72_09520 [Chitinophagaceae bacterium]|nr:hypothetical protein [Chitinophagaceae bacterium]